MFQKIHKYLNRMTPERPPVLREMEAYAADHDFPIIGPLVGRFLHQMALVTKARRILELGSGFGYSAYWFATAVKSKGHLTLTDIRAEHKRQALEFFKRAGIQSQIEFKVGNALNIAKRLSGPFDIILNDIDKQDYPKTLPLAARLLRKGGLFITDNVIWDGKVLEKSPDDKTRAIIEFTTELYRDSRFYTTVMPIRDGISVAVRL
jgi:caffeoyl-CoA O-methyltransferase